MTAQTTKASGAGTPTLAVLFEGGEDHALLATFRDEPLPPGFRRIGRVVEGGAAPLSIGGRPYTGRGGWDPYADWDARVG